MARGCHGAGQRMDIDPISPRMGRGSPIILYGAREPNHPLWGEGARSLRYNSDSIDPTDQLVQNGSTRSHEPGGSCTRPRACDPVLLATPPSQNEPGWCEAIQREVGRATPLWRAPGLRPPFVRRAPPHSRRNWTGSSFLWTG